MPGRHAICGGLRPRILDHGDFPAAHRQLFGSRPPLRLQPGRKHGASARRRLVLQLPPKPEMEIRRILCPTDLSEASAHAVDQAVVLAAHYSARITALHVINPLGLSMEGVGADRLGLRDEVAAFFEPATHAGIGVDVVLECGQPARSILARVSSLPADLIVMGTHGLSGFERLMLGSVTESVLRRSTVPVLTVPPRAHATSRLPFARVLCAVDFSDASLDAVRFALSLAPDVAGGLTLLHVIEWPWDEPPSPAPGDLPAEQGAALAEFRRYLERTACARLQSLVPEASTSRVKPRLRNGKPYVQILDVASEEKSDLIVVGVRGRNPLDLSFFGSTTNQVVRRATCPVLTVC